MSDRESALIRTTVSPDAARSFRGAASSPPDHWHDSGEMARVQVDSMIDIEPFRDSHSSLDELLREYVNEG